MNLLITGAFKYSVSQSEAIKKLGYNIINMPMESERLPIEPYTIDAVICNSLFLHHDIKNFYNLKFIQLTSAGLDRVPVDYIKGKDIKLYNARGVYSIPMAEWVIMRILENYKSSERFNNHQINKEWIKLRELREIDGINVAIIGAGNVGQEIAKRLSAFGAHVVGFDIHENTIVGFEKIKLISKFRDEVAEYDIIVLTAPQTRETKHIIDEVILSSMKNDSMLVNVSRGTLIDEKALIKVLSSRTDIYAALDVFETEPLSQESQLWEMGNVKVSPHNSFVGNGNQHRLFDVIINNLKAYATEN